MLIIMLTSCVVLLLACAAFVACDTIMFRQQLVKKESSVADVVGKNVTAAIDFNDHKTAGEALAALRAEPGIVAACIYDAAGEIFATYQRDAAANATNFPTAQVAGHAFTGNQLHLFLDIKQGGEKVGTIFVASDLDELSRRLELYAGIMGVVFLAALLIAFVLSSRLQRVISDPVLHLAAVARSVALENNYSLRASKQANDELGQLVDGFNEMLDQIQQRDAALQSARGDLERRVEERTNELAQSLSLLNATLESTADGILVVDRKSRVASYNSKFVEMWRLPREKIASGEADKIFPLAMEQLKDGKEFLAKVRDLYEQPEAESHDFLELKDGRVFERASQPQRLNGECVGRVWSFRDITERMQAEQKLAESRNFLDRIINTVPNPIFVKDRQHRGVLVNDAFCHLMGLKREQLLGKSDHDHDSFTSAQADEFKSKDELVFATGKENINEEPITAADGKVHFIITKKALYTDEKGEKFIVGVIQDITERQRAEESLRESQALYHSLVDQLPAGLFRKDKAGRYVFVNARFCSLKDVDAEQILGQTPLVLAAMQLARHGGELLASARTTQLAVQGESHHQLIMHTGQTIEVEEEYPDSAGNPQYLRVVKSPVFGPDGKIIGTQGMLFDITERKRAEAELAYERDLLRTLLDSSPDSIFFKDRQSRLVKLSRSEAANLLRVALNRYYAAHPGVSADQLPAHLAGLDRFHEYVIGKTDADAYGDEQAGSFNQDEQEIIRTGRPIIGKIEQTICPDGNSIWFLTTKVPWRNQDGEIIGTFGTSRDISDLKNAEAKVAEAHQRLLETSRQAGMAEVATNVLHNVGNVLNSVNVSATLVADSAKKSKIPYLAKVAALFGEHAADLGVFITTDPKGRQLPGYLSQLAEQLSKEQQSAIKELHLLRQNIEHIKDIVAMQQGYAKISGVTEIIQVVNLIEDALIMNAGSLARHEVELIREYTDAPPVTVEKHKVLQILVNLIRNAKHACDDSRRKDKQIRLQVAKTDDGVQIAVSDNGIGIPAENLARIFNHGFTTRKGGHGFGLHSGALAAREIGGSLTVHSAGAGQGATFTLKLPLQPPKAEA